MTRGSKGGAPEELFRHTEAGQLLEDIADHGERFAVFALPEAAQSFVADLRSPRGASLTLPLSTDIVSLHPEVRKIVRRHLDRLNQVHDTDTPRSPGFDAGLDGLGVLLSAWVVTAAADDSPEGSGEAISPSDPADVGDDGWGPVVPAVEIDALELQSLRLQVEQRREQLTNSFTRSEAAALLGVSPQTVSDMVSEHRLVGLKGGREWRLPSWQFTPDLEEPILPQIGRLTLEFPGGVVSLSRWMGRPNENFDGRTPAQAMIRESDRVFEVLRSLTAA